MHLYFAPRLLVLALLTITSSVAATGSIVFGFLGDSDISEAADVQAGIQLAFQEAGPALAVCNRSVSLATDSSATPQQRAEALLQLGVAGFVGSTGSISVNLSVEMARSQGVPVIAPLNGSHFLRSGSIGSSANVIHLRASLLDQGIAMVQHLRRNLSLELISLLYDPWVCEQATVDGISAACAQTGLSLLAATPLSSSVTQSVATLLGASAPLVPQAVIMCSSSSTASAVVVKVRQLQALSSASLLGVLTVDGLGTFVRDINNDTTGLVIPQVRRFFVPELVIFSILLLLKFKKGQWKVDSA